MDPDPASDPDPAIFIIDLQDANKKLIYYFLKEHLHHYSKIKVKKKSQNSRNQGFFLLFLLDDRRIRIRTSD
jgi:hypothetical protein